MNILITGSNGFIGKNLHYFLKQNNKFNISIFNKSKSKKELLYLLKKSNIVIHTAGINRSKNIKDFKNNNENLTQFICKNLSHNQKIIFTSSTQVKTKNIYGLSKLNCEKVIKKLSSVKKYNYLILRIPNVFGKWSKPNYNSVVATFCYNLSRQKKIFINNPNKVIKLIYIDDLVKAISGGIFSKKNKYVQTFKNTYSIKLKKLYEILAKFKNTRKNLHVDNLGNKLEKKLYTTYLSYIPLNDAARNMINHLDLRGSFQELVKLKKHGQVSSVIIKPKQERGKHFHFTKIERFFPIYGKGKFIMESIVNKKKKQIQFSSDKPKMIETIPGYAHKIVNNTNKDIIIIIWTNEIYNQNKPDTYYYNL